MFLARTEYGRLRSKGVSISGWASQVTKPFLAVLLLRLPQPLATTRCGSQACIGPDVVYITILSSSADLSTVIHVEP